MRENRLSGSMRDEARRSLALASQPARFAYSTENPRYSRVKLCVTAKGTFGGVVLPKCVRRQVSDFLVDFLQV